MKIIAFFVPQYHRIPLNDKYWGEGFTEWENVKKAKPLFEGHNQPRKPLNNNYYDLLDRETKVWQAKLAKEYGVYGFCYYHYWFDGIKLLERPCEQILEDSSIDNPFCFSWANEPWTKEWVGEKTTIIPQRYGSEKEWTAHWKYLIRFFNDDRYIKIDGKPIFIIYRPESIPCLDKMLGLWRELAKNDGLPGMIFMSQSAEYMLDCKKKSKEIDFEIEYEPLTSKRKIGNKKWEHLKRLRRKVLNFFDRNFGLDFKRYGTFYFHKMADMLRPSYDDSWNEILTRSPYSSKSLPCGFVDWDNSPRYGKKGQVYIGSNPNKFYKYFSALIRKARDEYHSDITFLFAWNEWGEGGYLEPDELNGYGYLESVRKALRDNDELP